ncbi:MAG: thiamine-phosphate kinase [Gammaproteobacteria bacterium]
MNEFNLIKTYFASQRAARPDVLLGIGDDCALLKPPSDQALAVSIDTLVENIHFFPTTSPHALGYKALAVSLSDLAAMGAEPAWVMLALTLPEAQPAWLEAFTAGFFELFQHYPLQLVGGNTTRGQIYTITTQVTGFIPLGQALTRAGAQVGDDIYVTHTLGDAGIALQGLTGKLQLPTAALETLAQRLHYPTPRVSLGQQLRHLAHAAIDISDGLVADLQHILEQSQVGASIVVEHLPLSEILQQLLPELAWSTALTAGDDYELCFTASVEQRSVIAMLSAQQGVGCHRIGQIEKAPGLRVQYQNGEDFSLTQSGYQHFT